MPIAITMYTLSVAIHVVFVVSFLAPTGASAVLGPMARDNPEHGLFALQVLQKLYKTLTIPGFLVVWGTGLYQVANGPFDGSELWLNISMTIFALMTLAFVFVQYPSVKIAVRELEAQSEPGPPSEDVQARLKKLAIVGPLQGLGLMIIAFLMAAKPF